MEKYINQHDKECWKDAELSSPFSTELFHEVPPSKFEEENNYWGDRDIQFAFHSELGSITVLDRMTGFGWRDIETGYRDKDGKFWLASGNYDVRESGSKTIGEAINCIKSNANTCNPDQLI